MLLPSDAAPEGADRSAAAVFLDQKVFHREAGDEPPLPIGDRKRNVHQIDTHPQRVVVLRASAWHHAANYDRQKQTQGRSGPHTPHVIMPICATLN